MLYYYSATAGLYIDSSITTNNNKICKYLNQGEKPHFQN